MIKIKGLIFNSVHLNAV